MDMKKFDSIIKKILYMDINELNNVYNMDIDEFYNYVNLKYKINIKMNKRHFDLFNKYIYIKIANLKNSYN